MRGRRLSASFRECHEDYGLPAADMSTICSIGPWAVLAFSENRGTRRPFWRSKIQDSRPFILPTKQVSSSWRLKTHPTWVSAEQVSQQNSPADQQQNTAADGLRPVAQSGAEAGAEGDADGAHGAGHQADY